jgi:polysaccharide export outer membrane protein
LAVPGIEAQPVPAQQSPAPAGQAAPGQRPGTAAPASPAQPPAVPQSALVPPPGYVIGPEDVLSVLYWREKDLSVDEVVVRPDGMISLPLLNDVKAAGLTPEQLRATIQEAARTYLEDPNVTVVVRTIHSRKVFITGQVAKPGPYPLTAPTTVLQLIAMAGGLSEFADGKHISIMRTEGGRTLSLKFNYNDVSRGKQIQQNIELKPGDTVVVP